MFVSPYNAQCQEIQLMGFDSITYHKLFGLSIRNDNENTNKIDLGDYECIYIIFPNQITLHINKRSKTADDK